MQNTLNEQMNACLGKEVYRRQQTVRKMQWLRGTPFWYQGYQKTVTVSSSEVVDEMTSVALSQDCGPVTRADSRCANIVNLSDTV